MIDWFLFLFPQYRELQAAARESAELATKLQDQNFSLAEQNLKLVNEAQQSREAQIEALKMMANMRIQVEYGGIAPFPEVYSLPKREEAPTGPIPTNRLQGRDVVRARMDDFREQLNTLTTANRS
jgi:hypothetical protein